MYLTTNFTLEELIDSETARRNKIDNFPAKPEYVRNLRVLAEKVLQPIRDSIGVPIKVNSGYRCPELNKLVGGKANSQHLQGEAADIVAEGKTVEELFNHIKKMSENGQLVVDQCIFERSARSKWVHVSYTLRRPNRNMFLQLNVV